MLGMSCSTVTLSLASIGPSRLAPTGMRPAARPPMVAGSCESSCLAQRYRRFDNRANEDGYDNELAGRDVDAVLQRLLEDLDNRLKA